MKNEDKILVESCPVIKRTKPNDTTVKYFADVTDENGNVHRVLQRHLPKLIPNGRKHMLRLRRERQLSRSSS